MAAALLKKLSFFSTVCRRGAPTVCGFVSRARNLHSFSAPKCATIFSQHKMPSSNLGLHTRSSPTSYTYISMTSFLQRRGLCIYRGIMQHSGVIPNKGHLVAQNNRFAIPSRGITILSKRGKRKTCKAVAKRFHRTGKGKLKRWKAGKNHNMMKKRNKTRKQLGKPTYCNKQQLKLLNKMLNGW